MIRGSPVGIAVNAVQALKRELFGDYIGSGDVGIAVNAVQALKQLLKLLLSSSVIT